MAVAAAQAQTQAQTTTPARVEKPRQGPVNQNLANHASVNHVPANHAAANHAQANDAQANHEDARWRPVLGLPCLLTVDLPVPNFKVADFLRLQAGSLVPTSWRIRRDVPLRVNGTLIGWCEFEGSSNCLAVRLTELA
jgi:flagellar motor switch/type III secretory pathway protein FliN